MASARQLQRGSGSNAAASGCLRTLLEATERNHQLELQATDWNGDLVVARTRVLGIEGGYLVVGQPRGLGEDQRASWFKDVDAYLMLSGKVFRFHTSVVKHGQTHRLNSEKKCVAALLAMPSELVESQRRNCYRVSTASLTPIEATASRVCLDEPAHSPLEGPRLEGVVANLSETGVGLCVESAQHMRHPLGETYSIRFMLPGGDEPVMLVGKLKNARAIRGGEASRFGFMFLRWPDPVAFGRAIRPVRRFAIECQREEARRKK